MTTEYKSLAAWFIGPKGENGDFFKELVTRTIDEHTQYRREHYKKDDPEYITQELKDSDEYKKQKNIILNEQRKLCEKLHGSVPFYTPRYQAHMDWDTVIPGALGYITAMLYNQNNVASEGSPVTAEMEKEVGRQLCDLLGFDQNRSWGHITADGSIANLESMWAARNIKYYPLAVKEALEHTPELTEAKEKLVIPVLDKGEKQFTECTAWELLNIDEDTVLGLSERIMQITGISDEAELNEYLSPYLLQNKGIAYYAVKYPEIKEPIILVPATKHYSWPKAATILGLGKDCVKGIAVDEHCRMDTNELKTCLEECAKERIPVIMVVNVIGSTEEGAIDDLCYTLSLKDQYRKGDYPLYFHLHCDAAWGGYLKTMLVPPSGYAASDSGYVPNLPMSEFGSRQFANLQFADTITIDPHKAGFIPYPAGSLCYRNEKLKNMITFNAAYIHSNPELNMGIYGVEGSKPGASAAAVWMAHRVIPLDRSGYGLLLGECSFSTKRYYCQWITLASENDDFEIRMLAKLPDRICKEDSCLILDGEAQILEFIRRHIIGKTNEEIGEDADAMYVLSEIGTDVLINAFIVNYKNADGQWNHDVNKLNLLNQKLFDKFSISDPQTAEQDCVEYILMMTTLENDTYAAPLKVLGNAWGIDFGGTSGVNCLVNTIMNPWTTTGGFIDTISKVFKDGIMECVAEMKGENA